MTSRARATDSRERLLAAAAHELATTGELEVAAVARRAGVSTGLPYRYFGTRSGLLVAVLDGFYEPATMAPGSCILFVGTLWHGGGANRSDRARLAVTAQYCQPWLRPQEAFTLSTGRDTARAVSADIRRMLGYSVHPPFVGMVDGMHPQRLLDAPS